MSNKSCILVETKNKTMEITISKYEDNLNDFAVAAVLAAAAFTSEDLEHVVDQHWSKNDDKEDIIRLICEELRPRDQKAYRRRVT